MAASDSRLDASSEEKITQHERQKQDKLSLIVSRICRIVFDVASFVCAGNQSDVRDGIDVVPGELSSAGLHGHTYAGTYWHCAAEL